MTTPRHEILFIDANVSDKETIIAGLSFDIETIILDDKTNVLNQIAAALAGYQNLDAIHIISHGTEGELDFANGIVTNSNINSYSSQLKRIGAALSANGDMLLYGCDIARGEDGLALINTLADLTGADVAASDDLTGPISLGGDWLLENNVGNIDTVVIQAISSQILGKNKTGTVTISGTLSQNQILTASNTLADLDGLGVISYQWFSNGLAITGATSSTYKLTQAEVNKPITVKASYTDSLGNVENVFSVETEFSLNTAVSGISMVTLPNGGFVIVGTSDPNRHSAPIKSNF